MLPYARITFKTQYQVYTWSLLPSYLNTSLKSFDLFSLHWQKATKSEMKPQASFRILYLSLLSVHFAWATIDTTRVSPGLRIPHPRVAIIFPHWDSFRSHSLANNEICRLSSLPKPANWFYTSGQTPPHPKNGPKSEPKLPETTEKKRKFDQEQKQTKRLTKQKLGARIFLPTLASASPGRSEPTGGPQTCYLKMLGAVPKTTLFAHPVAACARPGGLSNETARRAI